MRERPPIVMWFAMDSVFAAATASQDPKASFSCWYALPEFTSDVCWERIVNTSSEMGSYRGFCSTGPYRGSNDSNALCTVTEHGFILFATERGWALLLDICVAQVASIIYRY